MDGGWVGGGGGGGGGRRSSAASSLVGRRPRPRPRPAVCQVHCPPAPPPSSVVNSRQHLRFAALCMWIQSSKLSGEQSARARTSTLTRSAAGARSRQDQRALAKTKRSPPYSVALSRKDNESARPISLRHPSLCTGSPESEMSIGLVLVTGSIALLLSPPALGRHPFQQRARPLLASADDGPGDFDSADFQVARRS